MADAIASMAQARAVDEGRRTDDTRPIILYISTLDRILHTFWPHLDAMRAAGYRVEVACQVTVYRDEIAQRADALHEVPLKRFPLHPANIAGLIQLVRLMRRRQYHIVHAHNPTGGLIGRLAATLAGVTAPRVYTAHGFHFHPQGKPLLNLVYRAVETFAGHFLSDAVMVINREDHEAALRHKVVPADRLFLTPGVGISARNDFDPERISSDERTALRREWGADTDAVPVLTMVGEMIPRKRHADALEAFARVRETYPEAILCLVGDGALTEKLRVLARELGVGGGVRFLGFRRDIHRILAATDVFVFPSQQEGLPCSIQEALAMEVPVVTTAVRGCADLVDDSCGRVVPAGDPEALAAGCCELIALAPKERRRLGKAGREKMVREYDRPVCVARWQEIYDTLLARRGGRLAVPPEVKPETKKDTCFLAGLTEEK